MSTVAFGALATRREHSNSGTSTSSEPPGIGAYIDILAALVPAEVLAIHVLIVAATASQSHAGQLTLLEPNTLRWSFWLLVGLAVALFVLGRRPVPASAQTREQAGGGPRWQNWEWQDLIRIAIAPAAFVCWTMAEPSGVWSVVSPGLSSGMRLLIPLVGAVLLAAVTKALASHADKKPSPAQRRQAARAARAAGAASADQAAPASQPEGAGPGAPVPAGQPAPANQLPLREQPALPEPPALPEQRESPEDDTSPPALPPGNPAIDSVPKWVY